MQQVIRSIEIHVLRATSGGGWLDPARLVGPLSVGKLAAELPDLVQSGVSKHLMSLRAAGLVSADLAQDGDAKHELTSPKIVRRRRAK